MDRFADLMDLRGDRSRLDAYFGGRGARPQRPQQVSATAAAAAVVCMPSQPGAVAAAAAQESVTARADDGAAPGRCEAVVDSHAAACPRNCSPAQQSEPAATPDGIAAAVSASPLGRAHSCGDASEWDALSEGSPPPDDAAEQLQSDSAPAATALQLADAGMQQNCSQAWGEGAAAEAVDPDGSPPSGIAAGASRQQGVVGGSHTAAMQPQVRPAYAAIRDCSPARAADADAVAAEPTDDGGFAPDSVSLREQELIMAMISARNARRSSGSHAIPSPTGGSSAPGGGGGAAKDSKATTSRTAEGRRAAVGIAATRSAPLPSASQQAACSQVARGARGDGSPPQGKQKRQRTLAGFVVPRAQSCKS